MGFPIRVLVVEVEPAAAQALEAACVDAVEGKLANVLIEVGADALKEGA